ncbi:hypothetical protein HRG_003507 [Hirsutella rhossiliensis]|uniref:Meiotically up-regulated gene 154 protein n=1 Tax=Hirsutella rhossiliensis TaxID=111463 RepID=A0A9P8SK20_9HYPO|nr:uncharacterized protein HRG_03507 [Hirsutella rhossiliensis]KAH0965491.1 hypothetical protein HRG_03507 [Hirsutella rhossiliensis]
MPRLVRRRPLWERVASMLNPMDFLLWLSEEIETRDWDSQLVGTQLGLGLNFTFLLARANSGSTTSSDDVFGDDASSSWLSLIVYPLVWALVAFSMTNAVYTISRTRKYRMFEASIETQPSTPSARRVRAQSSPVSSSPLRFIADMMTPESAESRAHPDKNKDVWELSVWDPLPVCIRLFCFFSPGHVLVYLLFLPLAPLDPRPSMTVFNTLVMQIVLSAQLLLLSARFSQQAKDTTIIQREVMHEYDAKFVHPRLYPVVRDVGTQASEEQSTTKAQDLVQFSTPTTLLRRNFKPHRNPHADSPEATPVKSHSNLMKPQMFTPPVRRAESLAPTTEAQTGTRVLPSAGTQNFAGNMGIYTHNKSPLKKAISMGDINKSGQPSPRNSREMAAYEQRSREPPSSPTKHSEQRKSLGAGAQTSSLPLTNMGRHRPQYERYPSRW